MPSQGGLRTLSLVLKITHFRRQLLRWMLQVQSRNPFSPNLSQQLQTPAYRTPPQWLCKQIQSVRLVTYLSYRHIYMIGLEWKSCKGPVLQWSEGSCSWPPRGHMKGSSRRCWNCGLTIPVLLLKMDCSAGQWNLLAQGVIWVRWSCPPHWFLMYGQGKSVSGPPCSKIFNNGVSSTSHAKRVEPRFPNIKHRLGRRWGHILELPMTAKGNRYVLEVEDYLTKFLNLYALPKQTALSVAQCLFENYVLVHSIPETLHSDQGRQFEAKVV